MKMLLLFLLMFKANATEMAAQQKSVEDAKSTVRALIQPLIMPNAKNPGPKFSVDGCEKHEIDWMAVLTLQQTMELNYRFKDKCDIEGTIRPAVIKPFPAELKLRNLQNYDRMKSQNRITASLESKPVVFFEVQSGDLLGKDQNVKFTAEYRVRVNPMSKDKTVEENLGGTIHITEINGKKTNIKEKIKID